MDSPDVSVATKASVVAFCRVGRIQPPVPARQPASNQLQHHGPAARQLDTSAPGGHGNRRAEAPGRARARPV